jgi:glycosyltransferase involved in cell wall biosynthesis
MDRARVSVCMAAYNGSQYIREQVASILPQLDRGDEIVVVDDASQDGSVAILEDFHDKRIHIIRHKKNCGVLSTFERALREACGDIIFLADQDDIWAPDKVSVTLDAFQQHPESMVVVSDASCIDAHGTVTASSFFAKRRFTSGLLANLIHSRFAGCVMAFRAQLRSEILPFPNRYDVLHDIWIGTRNTISGGKTFYIDKPLIMYRRHSANLTSGARLSRALQLRVRFHLILALGRYWLRNKLTQPLEQE